VPEPSPQTPPYPPRPPRVPLDVVVIRADDVEPGIYGAVDISTGGMRLYSQRKERVGGFVALNFRLGDQDLHMYAEVVWCRSDCGTGSAAGLHTIGLKWMTTSPSALRAIQAYIESQLGASG
jgi:hypothetical protein